MFEKITSAYSHYNWKGHMQVAKRFAYSYDHLISPTEKSDIEKLTVMEWEYIKNKKFVSRRAKSSM